MIPKLLKYLEIAADESYLKDRGAAYRYTQKYKFQLTLLENFGELFKLLDITEDANIRLAVESGIPYLSNKQPKPMQVRHEIITLVRLNHLNSLSITFPSVFQTEVYAIER